MTKSSQLVRASLAGLCVISLALSQAPPKPSAPAPAAKQADDDSLTIVTTTRLVQVNVVVQDNKGNPVLGLKPEDFTINEQNKPQKIAFFSIDQPGSEAAPAVPLPPNTFTNLPQDSKRQIPNVTAILLDGLNTPWEDQSYARAQTVKFLSNLKAHDRIALYTLGRGLRMLHDFTQDREILERKLATYKGRMTDLLTASDPDAFEVPVNPNDPIPPPPPNFQEALLANRQRADATAEALSAIAARLSGIPGRKNLVWVTAGFPAFVQFGEGGPGWEVQSHGDQMRKVIVELNNANVAIYPVDARGLVGMPLFSASARGSIGPPPLLPKPVVANLETLNELANRTGGKAFYNTNAIDVAINEAIRDGEVSYNLAYYSTEAQLDDKYRNIRVRVNRPGLSVRYRKGYFATKPKTASAKDVDNEIRSALWSPLDSTAVGMLAHVKRKPGTEDYEVFVKISPGGLTIQQQKDRWAGEITLAIIEKDETGQAFPQHKRTVSLNMKRETYMQALQSGLNASQVIKHNPKAAYVRVIVVDHPTLQSGSLTIPLARVQAQAETPATATPAAPAPAAAPTPTP